MEPLDRRIQVQWNVREAGLGTHWFGIKWCCNWWLKHFSLASRAGASSLMLIFWLIMSHSVITSLAFYVIGQRIHCIKFVCDNIYILTLPCLEQRGSPAINIPVCLA